jgi:hypothetical protein
MGSEGGRRADALLRRARQLPLSGAFRSGLLLEFIERRRLAFKPTAAEHYLALCCFFKGILMQISLSLARKAVFGTAAVAAALMLGACGGGSGGDDNLLHAQFKIDSVTQDGVCEHVSVQATPKNLAPGQGSMSATKMFYTEIDMKQAKEGEVACAGEAQSSQPLGTGIWEFKVRLASGPSICERDIQLPAEGQPALTVSFKDGDTGCT